MSTVVQPCVLVLVVDQTDGPCARPAALTDVHGLANGHREFSCSAGVVIRGALAEEQADEGRRTLKGHAPRQEVAERTGPQAVDESETTEIEGSRLSQSLAGTK